jgi:hypothetical protein
MPANPRGGRLLRLVRKTLQAEATARYFLMTYLSQPALWPTFRTQNGANSFWALGTRQLRAQWPGRLAFSRILRPFDPAQARRDLDTS